MATILIKCRSFHTLFIVNFYPSTHLWKIIRPTSEFEYIDAQGGSVIHREAAIYAASSPEFRNGIPVARNFALIGTHQRE